jgi:hypothetical protein
MDTGRAGEFLCAYLLERHFGLEVHHVRTTEDDLWCRNDSGAVIRVQVKSANLRGRNRFEYFTGTRRGADVYAFVAIGKDMMLLKSCEWVGDKTRININTKQFTLHNMITTGNEVLAKYNLPELQG